MANFQSTNYDSSLAEVWKNYFDLWIDPPDRVISCLNLWDVINPNSDIEKTEIKDEKGGMCPIINVESVEKCDHVPNILVLKPCSTKQQDLEDQTQNRINSLSSQEISSISLTNYHDNDMFLFDS